MIDILQKLRKLKKKQKKLYQNIQRNKKKEIVERRKETNIKKYWVDNPLKSKEIQEKRKNTNINKYWYENVSQNSEVKLKIKETFEKKYEFWYPMKNKEISNKVKETLLNKTEEEKKEINEKKKETCIKKYWKNHTSKVDSIKNKFTNSILKRNYNIINSKLEEIVFHDITFEEYTNVWVKKKINFECKKCNTKFKDYINYNWLPKCPKCFPYNWESQWEREVYEYIKKLLIGTDEKIIKHDRDILKWKEIDILIKEIKIWIEYNWLMYHSFWKDKHSRFNNFELENMQKKNHLEKTINTEKEWIQLIHIFENEWKDEIKKSIVKSIIKNKLNKNKKYYARKLTLKKVEFSESQDFLLNNHLQWGDKSSIRIWLYNWEELLQLMTFWKSRYNKKINWEIHRLCSKKWITVIGWTSKIFKNFVKLYLKENESIITYSDLRYWTWKVYENIWFKYSHTSDPNFFYFKKGSMILESRLQFQKHKLEWLLEKYDETIIAHENMFNNWYRRIWDCWNKVFIYNQK